MGHGHVTPNLDGSLARCGGPALCKTCQQEATAAGWNGQTILPSSTPEYVFDLLRGLTTSDPLNFHGHVVPRDVQAWLEGAAGSGRLAQVPDQE